MGFEVPRLAGETGTSKTDLVYIKASNVISSLCYSILKLEPYTSCYHGCAYCYSKWYGVNHGKEPAPVYAVLRVFKYIAERVRRKGLKPAPFRLSTLVDPFQPCENTYGLSTRIMEIALEHEYPLVINTKSPPKPGSRSGVVLEKLLERNLAVLQVSVSTLLASRAGIIEPRAPVPKVRIRVLGEYGLRGLPVALRLSPFMPGVSPTTREDVEEFAGVLKDTGVKHVIVESLRGEPSVMSSLATVLETGLWELEYYSIKRRPGVTRISRRVLSGVYELYSECLARRGVLFATCKEGLFKYNTSPDCCGFYMLKDSAVRATLYDIYMSLRPGLTGNVDELYEWACKARDRLCGTALLEYPKPVSKAFKWHERKLLKVLSSREVLSQVAPDLYELLSSKVANSSLPPE